MASVYILKGLIQFNGFIVYKYEQEITLRTLYGNESIKIHTRHTDENDIISKLQQFSPFLLQC